MWNKLTGKEQPDEETLKEQVEHYKQGRQTIADWVKSRAIAMAAIWALDGAIQVGNNKLHKKGKWDLDRAEWAMGAKFYDYLGKKGHGRRQRMRDRLSSFFANNKQGWEDITPETRERLRQIVGDKENNKAVFMEQARLVSKEVSLTLILSVWMAKLTKFLGMKTKEKQQAQGVPATQPTPTATHNGDTAPTHSADASHQRTHERRTSFAADHAPKSRHEKWPRLPQKHRCRAATARTRYHRTCGESVDHMTNTHPYPPSHEVDAATNGEQKDVRVDASSPSPLQPGPPTKGERRFNQLAYGGIAGVVTFLLSIGTMYLGKYGKSNVPGTGKAWHVKWKEWGEALAKWKVWQKIADSRIGKWRPFRWTKDPASLRKSSENVLETTALMMGGNIMALAIWPLELKRVKQKIVGWFNRRSNDPNAEEQGRINVEAEPKKGAISLLAGRIQAWIVVFASIKIGNIALEKGSGWLAKKSNRIKPVDLGNYVAFGGRMFKGAYQRLATLFKRTPSTNKGTFWQRIGEISAIDLWATTAAAILLFDRSGAYAEKQAKKREQQHPQVATTPETKPHPYTAPVASSVEQQENTAPVHNERTHAKRAPIAPKDRASAPPASRREAVKTERMQQAAEETAMVAG